MNTKITIACGVLALLFVACGPDVSNLGLSDCMHTCNDGLRSCLAATDADFAQCTDDACRGLVIERKEKCIEDQMDCDDACVDEMQKKLK